MVRLPSLSHVSLEAYIVDPVLLFRRFIPFQLDPFRLPSLPSLQPLPPVGLLSPPLPPARLLLLARASPRSVHFPIRVIPGDALCFDVTGTFFTDTPHLGTFPSSVCPLQCFRCQRFCLCLPLWQRCHCPQDALGFVHGSRCYRSWFRCWTSSLVRLDIHTQTFRDVHCSSYLVFASLEYYGHDGLSLWFPQI